ncbi:hypothetical protein [Microvirga ossetica]|uniref:hypothetical protein n=1 Tax=Microvirga ossetica TaxID=1882682 RepID=UPI0013903796|nr:hypothetical protein [Microvirga ossetica]
MAVLTNPPETANFSFTPQKRPLLKETFRMPHQPVNVLLTKLTWLHFPLKRKVKGELTRRASPGSVMVNKKFELHHGGPKSFPLREA